MCNISGSWDNDIDREMVPGHQNMYEVPNLSPATTYHMRVVAENEVGTSDPSDPVTIITAEEGKRLNTSNKPFYSICLRH